MGEEARAGSREEVWTGGGGSGREGGHERKAEKGGAYKAFWSRVVNGRMPLTPIHAWLAIPLVNWRRECCEGDMRVGDLEQ